MNYVKKKKEEIASILIDICDRINIETPNNLDMALEFVYEDINRTADETWNDKDVATAFKKWIETNV